MKRILDFRFSIFDFWRAASLALALVITASPLFAQTITLKTGQKVDTTSLRREGAIVIGGVQVGSGQGEVGYNVAQIARIDFPEPRSLKAASDLLASNQSQKALAEIDPVEKYYAAFREIPGSWWGQAALLKISILSALQRDHDAENLAAFVAQSAIDPETTRLARVALSTGLIRKRQFEKALEYCDAAIKESTDPHVLAEAWMRKGDAYFGMKQWDDALMAYLHIPVFYSDETNLVPESLLGSARAYRRVDDPERAKKTFNELMTNFPSSPQAALAANEMRKLQKP